MTSPLVRCSPFIKWAGGKRQLLAELELRLPPCWNTYYEPFVGGGALLVHLDNHHRISRAVIGDLNSELVNLYRVVQKNPGALIAALSDETFRNDEESYKILKEQFNSLCGHSGT